MKLRLEWARPIPLTDASRENLIYSVDRSKLPDAPGIYVFGRRFGNNFESLYVGKATSIRARVHGQFKNLPLMMHLKNAKIGRRVILIGRYIPEPGHGAPKCIAIAERTLIRFFLSEGHDLVNKQGTRLRRHEIRSTGSARIIPKLMFLDKAKGE
jgi:hypothetical protein